ncbi:MAG TPA: tripartite tricarboxylate transporter TctB family protein [Thermodesulfobacteriota bacterium]|nr:tripartite tricarboxylate transporter TctB family protein [Thermodesulfobacteriota bacterium]
MPPRGDRPDIAFGAFLILLAVVALFGTRTLPVGTAADMGPGYVPRALAWILLTFGLVIGATRLRAGYRTLPRFDLRSFVTVLSSLAVFALLLPKGGLALASLATLACSTCAVSDFKWRESLLFAVGLTGLTILLFVNGLGLPLPVWPRW